ncbi:hypothetical protein NDU88_007930 [Pleurodeles waltl]|uniref:Retrotransposon gag domain-containing protein n=1 Tax=Pleurodeles waltl TaxID=8319 RepID=A0AAV7VTQ0_PLEWA|nr:hypothetical protein NDU88_007930 [Pleurodeles waltl]
MCSVVHRGAGGLLGSSYVLTANDAQRKKSPPALYHRLSVNWAACGEKETAGALQAARATSRTPRGNAATVHLSPQSPRACGGPRPPQARVVWRAQLQESPKELQGSGSSSEGQEVFDHLPDISDSEAIDRNEYETWIRKLDIHYLPKVSTILERNYFGKRLQREGECIESYVTDLRRLASSCKFGASTDERIRDQFMLGCHIEKMYEELWLRDDPPLDEVLAIAKKI